jgi:hypothetical protein
VFWYQHHWYLLKNFAGIFIVFQDLRQITGRSPKQGTRGYQTNVNSSLHTILENLQGHLHAVITMGGTRFLGRIFSSCDDLTTPQQERDQERN